MRFAARPTRRLRLRSRRGFPLSVCLSVCLSLSLSLSLPHTHTHTHTHTHSQHVGRKRVFFSRERLTCFSWVNKLPRSVPRELAHTNTPTGAECVGRYDYPRCGEQVTSRTRARSTRTTDKSPPHLDSLDWPSGWNNLQLPLRLACSFPRLHKPLLTAKAPPRRVP